MEKEVSLLEALIIWCLGVRLSDLRWQGGDIEKH